MLRCAGGREGVPGESLSPGMAPRITNAPSSRRNSRRPPYLIDPSVTTGTPWAAVPERSACALELEVWRYRRIGYLTALQQGR